MVLGDGYRQILTGRTDSRSFWVFNYLRQQSWPGLVHEQRKIGKSSCRTHHKTKGTSDQLLGDHWQELSSHRTCCRHLWWRCCVGYMGLLTLCVCEVKTQNWNSGLRTQGAMVAAYHTGKKHFFLLPSLTPSSYTQRIRTKPALGFNIRSLYALKEMWPLSQRERDRYKMIMLICEIYIKKR